MRVNGILRAHQLVSLRILGVTDIISRAFALLRRELKDIGIVTNLAKTVILPPKRHAATAEEISPRTIVNVRNADEGEVTKTGVPIGTD